MTPDIINSSPTLEPPDTLTPHPQNPNRGDTDAIERSIRAHGFYGAIIAQQSTGHVLAGNHRLEAAIRVGLEQVPVIWVDCDDDTATRILLTDNRLAEKATRDPETLATLLDSLQATTDGLGATGYTPTDLGSLLEQLTPEPPKHGEASDLDEPLPPSEDRASQAAALADKWGTAHGQVWQVGRHRVACGDATFDEFLNQVCAPEPPTLLLTDPPYGIDVVRKGQVLGGNQVAGSQRPAYAPVAGDDSTVDGEIIITQCQEMWPGIDLIIWGGNYFAPSLPASRGWIVWLKHEQELSFADVELAYTSFDTSARCYRWLWNGFTRQGDDEVEGAKRLHPTQKPVGLHQRILSDWHKGGPVLDTFAGSGTTLIACHLQGATCYAVELSPAYCAVMLERATSMGLEPRLIQEITHP